MIYMSCSADAVWRGSESTTKNGRKSFWIFGRTTFRSFFHRLAWTTNFSILSHFLGALAAYGLLTASAFGGGSLTSILIVLLSLKGSSYTPRFTSMCLDLRPIFSLPCQSISKHIHRPFFAYISFVYLVLVLAKPDRSQRYVTKNT